MTDSPATTTSTKVLLKDCCEEISQRIDNPAESGFERFVGLEHLKTGETSIRNWGSTEDVTSSMKLFKTGDVIVARRNVYLRRAARAYFDGVCSGDGIVLRPNSDICLPDLLPFLLNTDAFWNYVTSQADGTMSKRITVKRLLAYEFALPPMEEQRRIAKGLKIATSALEKSQDLSARLAQLRDALGFSLWNPKWNKKNMMPLGDVCIKIQDGTHFSPQSTEGEFLYVTSKNIRDGYLDISTAGHISREEHEGIYKRCDVQFGDLLLTKDGANAGNIAVNTIREEFSLLSSVAFIRVDPEKLDPTYAFEYLRSCVGQARLLAHVKGSAITRLTLTQIRGFLIPLPDIGTQKQNALELSEIQSRLDDLAGRQAALGRVITSMKQSLDMPV